MSSPPDQIIDTSVAEDIKQRATSPLEELPSQPLDMARFNDMPQELITVIMELALPSHRTWSNWPERSRALRSFSRVCHEWTPSAQLLLSRHPVINTAEQMARFQAMLKGDESGATSLWTGDGGRTIHGGLVLDLLPLCANLRCLKLVSVNSLVLSEIARCSTLQQLHCFKCIFVDESRRQASAGPFAFPSLRALHLDGTQLSTYPSAEVFPRLRTLALHNPAFPLSFAHPNSRAVIQQSDDFSAFVISLAPQITSLAFCPPTFMTLRLIHHIQNFASLRFIDISAGAFLTNRLSLDALGSLTTIRIQDSYAEADQLQASISLDPLKRRKVIVVTSGPASPNLLRLLASGVSVKVELKPTREGDGLKVGPQVSRQEAWLDQSFWEEAAEWEKE